MKFYKDTTTGLWHVGDYILPAGSLLLKIASDTSVILMWPDRTTLRQQPIEVSDITDESDEAYADMDAFITANKTFFA